MLTSTHFCYFDNISFDPVLPMLVVNNIIRIFKKFSWFKRLNAKVTYEVLAKYLPTADWHFMNYGYVPDIHESKDCIAPFDVKSQRYAANMYHYLACKVELGGKIVLEVGSGRGGGANYIASNFNPAHYTGIDIAQNAIELARKLHTSPNLAFVQGSGESLKIQDDSIDVVINVESSHGYGNVNKFLSEVRRVLKPGGHLLLVDFRNAVEKMELFRQQLKESGLTMLSEENINERVIAAIESENDFKKKKIESMVPPRYQKLFCDFAGVVGSPFYNTLKDGSRPYCRFVLRKPSGL